MSTSSTIEHTKDAVNLPVHLPSFYDEFRDFKLHPPTNSEARKLDKKDWITDELMEEIKNCVPSVDDIDKAKDNVRCQESFSKMVKIFFPVGQIFCSHIQLFQVASKFAGFWAFEVTRSGCAIQCHFSKPTYQTKCCTDKARGKSKESLKLSIKCPFKIGYNVIGLNWRKKKLFLEIHLIMIYLLCQKHIIMLKLHT